jgi:NOL1/NOP2/sun family putative RNA methylase
MIEQLPQAFLNQMRALLGPNFDNFFLTYQDEPARAARFQYGQPENLEQIPWEENARYIPFDSSLGQSIEHEAGAFYIQEPSAMLPARLLSPKASEKVLDLCAAPGGKATQLAQIMQNTGVLVCNEPIASRAKILSSNIERMGIACAIVAQSFPETLAQRLPNFFDKILVDAPCSGEGMFRKNPEVIVEWSQNSPETCARRQSDILDCAAQMLRPGGKIVYSTCTFNEIENEGVIKDFLSSHPEFATVDTVINGLKTSKGCIRLYPHTVKGEGHFACLLEKSKLISSNNLQLVSTTKKTSKYAPPHEKTNEVLSEVKCLVRLEKIGGQVQLFQNSYVLSPIELEMFEGIKLLRLGLHLGKFKGKTFIPDHALARALPAKHIIPLSKEDAYRYLYGEELGIISCNISKVQFVVVSYQGLPLGWAKIVGDRLKNHYPKGLRKALR